MKNITKILLGIMSALFAIFCGCVLYNVFASKRVTLKCTDLDDLTDEERLYTDEAIETFNAMNEVCCVIEGVECNPQNYN